MKDKIESELWKLRKKLGLTKTEAATKVKVNPKTWARWEAGETKIPEALLALFKLKIDGVKDLITSDNVTPSMIIAKRDKLSKAEAARLVGVTVGTWRRYEAGTRRMRRGLYEYFLRQLQLTRKNK
jgi:DNA-binding XRE family transcriptional regulator